MPEDRQYLRLLFSLIGAALLIILGFLLFLLIGCNPAKKAQRELDKAKQVLNSNLTEAARFCNEKFPNIPEYSTSDTIVQYDTLWGLQVDTLYRSFIIDNSDTVVKTVPKVIVKTVTIRDTVRVENRARLIVANADLNDCIGEKAVLKNENDGLKKNLSEWRKKAKERFWLLALVVGLTAGWLLRKQIPKLLKFI